MSIIATEEGWIATQYTDSDWGEIALRNAFLEKKIQGKTLTNETGSSPDSFLGRVATSKVVTFYPIQEFTREATQFSCEIDLGEENHRKTLKWQKEKE